MSLIEGVEMRAIRLVFLATMLACLVGLLSPGEQARAAEYRSGDITTIPSTETIDGDLYITGRTVNIAGRVTGDVVAIAGEVNVTGQVEGSLQVVGGSLDITGDVGGSVRAAGGDVTISGDVGRDVVMASGSLTVRGGGAIDGDLLIAGGDIEVLGPVSGDIRGVSNTMTIDSRVGGSVDITAEEVVLLSKARIVGDLTYASKKTVSVATEATVTGETNRTEPSQYFVGDSVTSWLMSPLFRLLCALIAGLVLILLLPIASAAVADAARLAPLTSLLLGLVLLIVAPFGLTVLMFTVVGVPIALIGFIVYFSILYLSQVFLGLAIGRLILPSSWDTRSRGYNLLAMTLGVLIIGGLRMVPFPWVGNVIAAASAVIAIGAVSVAVRAARRPAMLAVR